MDDRAICLRSRSRRRRAQNDPSGTAWSPSAHWMAESRARLEPIRRRPWIAACQRRTDAGGLIDPPTAFDSTSVIIAPFTHRGHCAPRRRRGRSLENAGSLLRKHAVPHIGKRPEDLAHFRHVLVREPDDRNVDARATAIRRARRPRRGAACRAPDTTPAAPRAAATPPTDRGTRETGCLLGAERLPAAGRRTLSARPPGIAHVCADPEEHRADNRDDRDHHPGDEASCSRLAQRRPARIPTAAHGPIELRRRGRRVGSMFT